MENSKDIAVFKLDYSIYHTELVFTKRKSKDVDCYREYTDFYPTMEDAITAFVNNYVKDGFEKISGHRVKKINAHIYPRLITPKGESGVTNITRGDSISFYFNTEYLSNLFGLDVPKEYENNKSIKELIKLINSVQVNKFKLEIK